jgi:hypothetical protein
MCRLRLVEVDRRNLSAVARSNIAIGGGFRVMWGGVHRLQGTVIDRCI